MSDFFSAVIIIASFALVYWLIQIYANFIAGHKDQ